jgi:hypothetical protein
MKISKIISLLLAFIFAFALSSCKGEETPTNDEWAEVFSDGGMSITLTSKFYKSLTDSATPSYRSSEVTVTTQKTAFSTVGSSILTPESYALELMSSSGISEDVKSLDRCAYFSSTVTLDGEELFYSAFCYKSADSYWVVKFFSANELRSKYETRFVEWAQTVKFE